jgi:hypothetical protein
LRAGQRPEVAADDAQPPAEDAAIQPRPSRRRESKPNVLTHVVTT